jgi:TfoX/Sxy family transcriptional regulator of competence genes
MFGYSCIFARGNMFAGLHEAGMVLRLSDEQRAEFLRLKGAKQFEPMPERVMREYVVVPKVLLDSPERLRTWIEKSLAYVSSLPAKAKRGLAAARGWEARRNEFEGLFASPKRWKFQTSLLSSRGKLSDSTLNKDSGGECAFST